MTAYPTPRRRTDEEQARVDQLMQVAQPMFGTPTSTEVVLRRFYPDVLNGRVYPIDAAEQSAEGLALVLAWLRALTPADVQRLKPADSGWVGKARSSPKRRR